MKNASLFIFLQLLFFNIAFYDNKEKTLANKKLFLDSGFCIILPLAPF